MTPIRLALLGLVVLFLIAAAMFVRPTDRATASLDKASQRSEAGGNEAQPRAAPRSPAAEAQPEEPQEPLFPGKTERRCPAPPDVPEGRHLAAGSDVLVRGGSTSLWTAQEAGTAPVFQLGRSIGTLAWTSDACEWADEGTIVLTIQVDADGQHVVAGCPVGTAATTDSSGFLQIDVPQSQPCAARVVSERGGLSLGRVVQVAADRDTTIELEAPTEPPFTPAEIRKTSAMLQRMTQKQIDARMAELDRLVARQASHGDAAWLVEQEASTIEFLEGELARHRDPATQEEAVADFLFSQAN